MRCIFPDVSLRKVHRRNFHCICFRTPASAPIRSNLLASTRFLSSPPVSSPICSLSRSPLPFAPIRPNPRYFSSFCSFLAFLLLFDLFCALLLLPFGFPSSGGLAEAYSQYLSSHFESVTYLSLENKLIREMIHGSCDLSIPLSEFSRISRETVRKA